MQPHLPSLYGMPSAPLPGAGVLNIHLGRTPRVPSSQLRRRHNKPFRSGRCGRRLRAWCWWPGARLGREIAATAGERNGKCSRSARSTAECPRAIPRGVTLRVVPAFDEPPHRANPWTNGRDQLNSPARTHPLTNPDQLSRADRRASYGLPAKHLRAAPQARPGGRPADTHWAARAIVNPGPWWGRRSDGGSIKR